MANEVWALIDELGKKNGITEIMINSPESIFIERQGQIIQINAQLTDKGIDQFVLEVAKLNGKICDSNTPILDGKLPDGSRVNIITKPYVDKSPAISIRKYLKTIVSFDKNPDVFGLGPQWITFFKAIAKAKLNVVVSGGTGAGKTTFLNLLINEIPKHERVVTIEDTLELNLQMPNVVRLDSGIKDVLSTSKVDTRALVKNTLRMRPDRIIIGESRGPELFDLIQAMNTGHDGSFTTIHSNSCIDCLSRMETLYMMSGFEMPILAIRKHISSVVHFIVQLAKDKNGNRVIEEIIEINGMEGNHILRQTIAKREDGYLIFKGAAPSVMNQLHEKAGLPINFFENF